MLQIKNICKSYKTGTFVQKALNNASIEFRKNEFVAILGPSGSGKTTMLNIIGGLDRYDSGDLIINNKSTKKFKSKDWDAYRNNCIGFIFQSYNLISHINIQSNVEMGMILSGKSKKYAKNKSLELLEKVGLKEHAHKKPNQLSGGQMQRVAIARALANDPNVILADEPTGALDSKTSVQIMELIKEISKDKLVIMVTHNPELAKMYATRIIEFKDGEVVSDSNPITKKSEKDSTLSIKNTKMNLLTALKLSFNNICTKKGRTFITAFAASIGIIGIALILGLSNGFQIQIDKFEKDTLSQMPITISQTTQVISDDDGKEIMDSFSVTDKSYTNKKEIYPIVDFDSVTHYNNLNDDYIKYINNLDEELLGGISFVRGLNMNLLHKANSKVSLLNQSFLFPLPEQLDGSKSAIIDDNFELIYGRYPEKDNEIMLLIDINNGVNQSILKALGFDSEKAVKFDEIINQEFKIVLNDDFYDTNGIIYYPNQDLDKLYNNKNNITLKVTGIIRGVEGSTFAQFSGNGFCYKENLAKKVIELNEDSKIVKAQKKSDFNVMTGQSFDLTTQEGKLVKENILSYIGANSTPYVIQIYPKDFDKKDQIIEYLDEYNDKLSDENKVIYVDMAKEISEMSGGIMDGITVVLIAFSSISLIVSSIMIGIITYISVLERTKEIGILKALGARNKDITRVFNAETLIIGLSSGLIGLIIANLLCIPINIIIEDLTQLQNVAKINILHEVILLIISVLLTLIGGFIPSKIAAKKDPVNALRTE